MPTERPIAVVAGGAGALGRAVVKNLAAKGFKVFCGYHSSADAAAELAREHGGEAILLSSDLSAPDPLEPHYEKVSGIRVLVNASGVNIEGHALGLEQSEWDRVMEVNFNWAARLTRSAVKIMLPNSRQIPGGGRIIHLSSLSARAGGRGQLNYACSKAALERLVKGFAMEVGARNILVNAVAPGIIHTPMSRRIIEQYGPRILERVSLGRFGLPEEVASVVGFLAGPDSAYVTGSVVAVDGGGW
ncbi:MAG: SDR family oxidoreductase [Deltaproteobacteria bacterium]|jgi:3-oxoacyl-[acyl-carrier protein] reductase|nr:SDR family oxidoreductase [Deltaproteobacteria bacterium]